MGEIRTSLSLVVSKTNQNWIYGELPEEKDEKKAVGPKWACAIPGAISFEGSTLLFQTAKQAKDQFLVRLNLKELNNITPKKESDGTEIILNFKLHGDFLQEKKFKVLFFYIFLEPNDNHIDLLKRIDANKKLEPGDPDMGNVIQGDALNQYFQAKNGPKTPRLVEVKQPSTAKPAPVASSYTGPNIARPKMMGGKPAPERKSITITCTKCHWAYSSTKDSCPMCGAPMLLGDIDVIKILQEYVDLQGIYLEKKDAEEFIKSYKKQFKKLPGLDDLWNAALKLTKLEEMEDKDLKKIEDKKRAQERAQVQQKMDEIKAQKIKDQEEKEREKREKEDLEKQKKEEERRLKEEAKLKKAETACPSCGAKNPSDSKFCLECGAKLS
jgi:hypothetical protein